MFVFVSLPLLSLFAPPLIRFSCFCRCPACASAIDCAMVREFAFAGGVETLVKVLIPHARVPDFVVYGEQMARTAINPAQLVKNRLVLRDLLGLCFALAFKPIDLQAALRAIAAAQYPEVWPRQLSELELDDYCTRMSMRIRTMCSHVVRTRSKHPETAWLVKIFEGQAGMASASVSKRPAAAPSLTSSPKRPAGAPKMCRRPAAAPARGESEVFPGFDFECGKGFLADATGKKLKWADVTITAADDEHPTACFEGKTFQLESVTNAEVRGTPVRQPAASLWTGEREKIQYRIIRRPAFRHRCFQNV